MIKNKTNSSHGSLASDQRSPSHLDSRSTTGFGCEAPGPTGKGPAPARPPRQKNDSPPKIPPPVPPRDRSAPTQASMLRSSLPFFANTTTLKQHNGRPVPGSKGQLSGSPPNNNNNKAAYPKGSPSQPNAESSPLNSPAPSVAYSKSIAEVRALFESITTNSSSELGSDKRAPTTYLAPRGRTATTLDVSRKVGSDAGNIEQSASKQSSFAVERPQDTKRSRSFTQGIRQTIQPHIRSLRERRDNRVTKLTENTQKEEEEEKRKKCEKKEGREKLFWSSQRMKDKKEDIKHKSEADNLEQKEVNASQVEEGKQKEKEEGNNEIRNAQEESKLKTAAPPQPPSRAGRRPIEVQISAADQYLETTLEEVSSSETGQQLAALDDISVADNIYELQLTEVAEVKVKEEIEFQAVDVVHSIQPVEEAIKEQQGPVFPAPVSLNSSFSSPSSLSSHIVKDAATKPNDPLPSTIEPSIPPSPPAPSSKEPSSSRKATISSSIFSFFSRRSTSSRVSKREENLAQVVGTSEDGPRHKESEKEIDKKKPKNRESNSEHGKANEGISEKHKELKRSNSKRTEQEEQSKSSEASKEERKCKSDASKDVLSLSSPSILVQRRSHDSSSGIPIINRQKRTKSLPPSFTRSPSPTFLILRSTAPVSPSSALQPSKPLQRTQPFVSHRSSPLPAVAVRPTSSPVTSPLCSPIVPARRVVSSPVSSPHSLVSKTPSTTSVHNKEQTDKHSLVPPEFKEVNIAAPHKFICRVICYCYCCACVFLKHSILITAFLILEVGTGQMQAWPCATNQKVEVIRKKQANFNVS